MSVLSTAGNASSTSIDSLEMYQIQDGLVGPADRSGNSVERHESDPRLVGKRASMLRRVGRCEDTASRVLPRPPG